MKLSKKGFKKIISTCKFDDAIATYTLNFSSPDKDYCFEVQGTSFKSNDFEDCVMLTIAQSKELAMKLKHNAEFFFLQTGEFDYDTDELWQCLTEKIEKAEKKDGR